MNEPTSGEEPEQHGAAGAIDVAVPDVAVPDGTTATGRDAESPAAAGDDGPRPLGVRIEPTGHPPVDARLRRLEDADHLATSGHLEVYEDVHRGLRDTLTALDRHEPRS